MCAEENHSVGVEVVRGTFSFPNRGGGQNQAMEMRFKWRDIAHLNACRFNSAAPGLLVYLVGAKSEEFPGHLSEIMILTHHILPGLLKTKPVSANKQKNESHWLHGEGCQ